MKLGRGSDSGRAALAPAPTEAAEAGDTHAPQRCWLNVLMLGGADRDVLRAHRTLTHAQGLPWRSSEEVEREVVYLALRSSGRRIEALTLEDVLSACEQVEERHLIDNGAIARHFRNLWNTSSAYCKHFMRGLLALKPGDVAAARAPAGAGAGLFREGFSLTRIVLPPYRVLQGSYRYAGRSWCMRHWGTPEDARLLEARFEAAGPGRRLAVYEFETVDQPPQAALERLCERHPRLALGCVSIDLDSGHRQSCSGGAGAAFAREPLTTAPTGIHGPDQRAQTAALARRAVLVNLPATAAEPPRGAMA